MCLLNYNISKKGYKHLTFSERTIMRLGIIKIRKVRKK